jgi:fucose permease
LLTAIALFGFSLANEFYQLCLIAIPYGLGAGAIDASLNNYVALHYNSRHMSWLHCFWGVGTIISPYIMSYALAHSVWNDGYRAVSFIQLGIFVVLLCSMPMWRVNEKKDSDSINVEPIGLVKAVKIKGVLPVILGFLCYCATESTAMLWASSYFEGVYAVSKEDAAALGAIFFIGMTVGRFISGFVSERVGDSKMIRIGALLALVGIGMIAIPVKSVAIIGFITLGLGCAPIYPSIIHSTPLRFGAEKSQSIIGIQMASAYLGSTLMPPLFGLIANHISLSLMPIYLAFFVALMLILLIRADKETLRPVK